MPPKSKSAKSPANESSPRKQKLTPTTATPSPLLPVEEGMVGDPAANQSTTAVMQEEVIAYMEVPVARSEFEEAPATTEEVVDNIVIEKNKDVVAVGDQLNDDLVRVSIEAGNVDQRANGEHDGLEAKLNKNEEEMIDQLEADDERADGKSGMEAELKDEEAGEKEQEEEVEDEEEAGQEGKFINF